MDGLISFVCEASGNGGHGHLRRCLTLREYLRNESDVKSDLHIVANPNDPGVWAATQGWPVQVHMTLDSFLASRASCVASLLHFDFSFPDAGGSAVHEAIHGLKANGRVVSVFSDQLRIDLCTDAAFSHVAYCDGLAPNAVRAGTHLYSGSNYYPVRRQDIAAAMSVPPGDHVLIMFGGTDASRLTEIAAHRARDAGIAPLLIVLGAGAADKHRRAVSLRAAGFEVRVAPEHMLTIIRTCRAAIVAGGNQLYDLAIMDVPAFAVALTDRQALNIRALARNGRVSNIERPWSASTFRFLAEQIADIPRAAEVWKTQSDHGGTGRICDILLALAHRNHPPHHSPLEAIVR